MGKHKTDRTEMVRDVAVNGGEYSYKTVKGKVQDIHHTKPKYQMPDVEITTLHPNGDADYKIA